MHMATSEFKRLYALYIVAIFAMFSLYGVQSIQPILQQELQIAKYQAALFTTFVMLPMGIAPLFYGYLLHGKSIKKVLRFSILYLGIFEIIFAFSSSYEMLLLVRFLQGLAIPAVLTTLASYISSHSQKQNIQQNMAFYIGSTIVGGFFGRYISGLCSEFFGWRIFFIALGIVLFVLFYLLQRIDEVPIDSAPKSIKSMFNLIFDSKYMFIFIAIFFVFFIFSAILNFLPFELYIANPQIKPSAVGFIYIGYVMGLLVSIFSNQIRAFFGSEHLILKVAISIYILSILLFLQEGYYQKLLIMFLFCLGMFLFHTTSSGYINKIADSNKSMLNGLYISFYYLGGTAGSIIPGYIYDRFGWNHFVLFLTLIAFLILIYLFSPLSKKHF